MHDPVRRFIAEQRPAGQIVEFGARDVNGNVRDLCTDYWGIDIAPGAGVDELADAATWVGDADTILCLEVLEHADDPAAIIANAGRNLTGGGRLIVTCATDPRPPHSAHDGGPIVDGEPYRNIGPDELVSWCHEWGRVTVLEHDLVAGDLRAVVVKQ